MRQIRFVGPSYNLRRRSASVQRTVNMAPVPVEPGNERSAWVFKDVPGLELFWEPVLYYTSLPYPYEATEEMSTAAAVPVSGYVLTVPLDALNTMPDVPVAGQLLDVVHTYSHSEPEGLNTGLSLPQGGTLVSVLVTYSHSAPEGLNTGVSIPLSGTLPVVLVTYTHPAPEEINTGVSIPTGGTLT
jgi:hypothetical protein